MHVLPICTKIETKGDRRNPEAGLYKQKKGLLEYYSDMAYNVTISFRACCGWLVGCRKAHTSSGGTKERDYQKS